MAESKSESKSDSKSDVSFRASLDSLVDERISRSPINTALDAKSDQSLSSGLEYPNPASKSRHHDVEKLENQTSLDAVFARNQSEHDPSIVDWDGDEDPENPMNWPIGRKIWMSTVAAATTFIVSIASSVWSEDVDVTAKEFGVSREVTILGVSLYVLGFACGPLVFGPISELYGRSRPLIFGFFCFAIFQIPIAVATNLETIFICRFLSAAFAAAPIAVSPGILVDMWEPYARGIASLVWSLTVFAGPTVGPLVGAFTVENPNLGWRWTAWLILIIAMALWVVIVPTVSESFAPILLQRRAARLRHETRNWALHSKRDEDPVTYGYLMRKYGLKPFKMLVQDILACMTTFMSLVYALIYLMFVAFPYAFQVVRGWDLGIAALPFIGLFLGYLLGSVICITESTVRFRRLLRLNNGSFAPEERLPTMILGSFVLIAGLFWFAWTSSKNITWIPQVISSIPIGAGIFLVFVPGQVYLMDVYTIHAASAIAGNAFVRAALACAFPLIGDPMYETLGVAWGMSLLGFICVALAPFPIAFYLYGHKVRAFSKYVET